MVVIQPQIIKYMLISCIFTSLCVESNDYDDAELSQQDTNVLIDRRWLSESNIHSTDNFRLSQISAHMDEIVTTYQEHSHWINISITNANTTRRRLQTLTNEGSWNCNTTSQISESFANISSQLELFNDLNCTHDGNHEEHEHIPDGVYLVLYCAFVLFIGVLLKYLQHRFHIPLPYTVLLLITGVILETIEMADDNAFGHLNKGFSQVRKIDPHMVLSLFIPGLIFESAFNTNYHIFLKEAQQAAMLAGPGVLVNALLIGGVMHYFAHSISTFSTIDDDGYNWTWSFSIMFGSIVSATDPVAVVALLKELGASKRLSTLIEAESLLNDGTAFVMFTVLKLYAASPSGTSFGSMLVTFVQLAFGGGLWGIFCGTVCCYVLAHVYNDFEIEITVTLSLVYLFAYTADFVFKFSGVLTIVFMGLWVSKNKEAISPHVEEAMRHFWEMIGFIANTLLFFLTGQVIAFRIADDSVHIHWATDVCILIMLYVCCHIIRALAIWQMHPVLKNTGYGCTLEDSIVMVYGGLRGAIGLALALIVEMEPAFDKLERDRVLFHVCGIVTLTLLINAPTVKFVVQYLGLNKPPSDTAALFKSATQHLMDDVHHKLNEMKLDKHYIGANWLKVDQLQPKYDELYLSIFGEEMNCEEDEHLDDLSVDESEPDLIINMLAELQRADRESQQKQAVEKRVISVMKSSYWTQYENGLISADAVNILVESSEDAMDEHDLTKQRKNLKKWFSIPWYIKTMHQSQVRYIKKLSEWLLFGNLGFAVEIASGFVYASKSAMEFCHLLLHNDSIDNKHIKFVEGQLKDVTDWIEVTGSDVVRVYPEVHTAIQTKHAAHSLLNYQKEEIDHLLHKGFLDEAEHGRVMTCCEESLNQLFHTTYTKLLDKNHDDESILLQSPLFSELSYAEKKLIIERAKPSKWYKKGEYLMREGNKSRKLFVITRGTIFIYEGNRRHIHTKERGDVLDVYALLQDNVHDFNFMISTDQCHGYWLDLSLLSLLKDSNIDFWDTLWKCAACDVMRFYFSDQQVMNGVDLSDLDNIVYQSPLSFFDPHNRYRCEIRVNRGVGVLLNGQVVHITDMNSKAFAPALLPVVDEPYVSIEDSVVLYLDMNRQDYHGEKTSHLNPKLAKLMGLTKTTTMEEEEEEVSDYSCLGSESMDKKEEDEYDEEYTAQEQRLLVSVPISEDKDITTTTSLKTGASDRKSFKGLRRQESNIGKIDRYRSKKQLNRAGRKEMVTHCLNDKQLPSSVSAQGIEEDWTIKECFEVVKYVLAKHEGLFEHAKKFHVRHLQDEILKQYSNIGPAAASLSDEESVQFDDESFDLDPGPDEVERKDVLGISRPGNMRVAQSVDERGKSLFARPSSMKYSKKKMSMPNIDPNRDADGAGGRSPSSLSVRKNTLNSLRFISSRYLLSQQRAAGVGSMRMSSLRTHRKVKGLKKQVSETPAIIKAKNYTTGKRKSARISFKNKAQIAEGNESHHKQQSTQIDGWEDAGDANQAVVSLIADKDDFAQFTTPLKEDNQIENKSFYKQAGNVHDIDEQP